MTETTASLPQCEGLAAAIFSTALADRAGEPVRTR
jgi:hypothetical protein